MGCCLTLVVVPLLLLATPQRSTLQGQRHRSGAATGRVRVAESLDRLSTSWTIPVVFADLSRSRSTPASGPATVTTAAAGPAQVENVSFQPVPTTASTTTPTTRPSPSAPIPAPDAVAAAPKPVTAPKPVPAPAPEPPPSTTAGIASWYGAPAGTCASPSLPFGTVVTVTDLSTGASTRCTVDDREAHNPGRVVDLSPATFSALASLAVGVIEVRLTW